MKPGLTAVKNHIIATPVSSYKKTSVQIFKIRLTKQVPFQAHKSQAEFCP